MSRHDDDYMGSGMTEKEYREWEEWYLCKHYSDPKQAEHDWLSAQAEMSWLSNNLSGCDWCCGGGDEQMWRHRMISQHAREYLLSVGIDPYKTAPELCWMCSYYERLPDQDECAKCHDHLCKLKADEPHHDKMLRLINHIG